MNIVGVESLTPAEAAAIGGIAAGAFVTIAIFATIFYVLLIVACWKIFEKAGEKGWKSIIPIYNIYILYKIVKMESWFWWMIAIALCTSLTLSLNGFNQYSMTTDEMVNYNFAAHPAVIIALLAACVVGIYVEIVYAYRTAKVFGHGIGFTLGLIFFPNIFYLVLGFDKSKYDKKALKK